MAQVLWWLIWQPSCCSHEHQLEAVKINIRWSPAGLRNRVHADAWQMQTYTQIEHIVVQAEQQQQQQQQQNRHTFYL